MSLWAVGWISSRSAVELERGLAAVAEAAEIYTVLAQELPAAFLENKRATQGTRAALLEALGRHEEAAKILESLGASINGEETGQ